MATPPEMWVNGNELSMIIESTDGPLFHQSLTMAAVIAQMTEGELMRYTFDLVDLEDETTIRHGAARIMIEIIPDPRPTQETA